MSEPRDRARARKRSPRGAGGAGGGGRRKEEGRKEGGVILPCQNAFYESNIEVFLIVVKEVKTLVNNIYNYFLQFFQKSKIFQNPKFSIFQKPYY